VKQIWHSAFSLPFELLARGLLFRVCVGVSKGVNFISEGIELKARIIGVELN
jgi:hypothetical protein